MRPEYSYQIGEVSGDPVVYGLKDPGDGKFYYVGQTTNVDSRFQQHVSGKFYDGNYPKAHWIRQLKDRGLQPELVVLQRCQSISEADVAEKMWIRRMIEDDQPILNITDGGQTSRSVSKMGSTRKKDWIELGYVLKCARQNTLDSLCMLSRMLPKNSPEMRSIDRALKAIEDTRNRLDGRICQRYPRWKEFTKVFYGAPEEHSKNLSMFSDED